MSETKRISGDLNFESINDADAISIKSQNINLIGRPGAAGVNTITIDGHLIVTGNTSTVTTTNTEIADNFFGLNSGEAGAGVTNLIPGFDSAHSSGIIVDRGTAADVAIRFNEDVGYWEGTDDGTVWWPLWAARIGTFELISDPTPQLAGDLDVNGHLITSAANGDVVLVANGTGQLKFNQEISLLEQVSDETGVASYGKIYAKVPPASSSTGLAGDTGLFFVNTSTGPDELASRRKAFIWGLVF